jgi:hypothetical protein
MSKRDYEQLFFVIDDVHDRVSDIEKTYHAKSDLHGSRGNWAAFGPPFSCGTTTELSSVIPTPPHLCWITFHIFGG